MAIDTKAKWGAGYKISPLVEADFASAEDIWSLAFGAGWPREYARKELSTVLGAFEGKALHAVAALVDLEISFADRMVPCGGVAAVATAPGQRYQSLVRLLLTELLRKMHDRQVPFSTLYPFSYPFYERMGWAVTHWLQEIQVSTAALSAVARRGNAKNWRMLPLERCEEILPVHERLCSQYNLFARRSPERCRFGTFMPGRRMQYFLHDDGYMLWDLDLSREGRLYVLEFGYTTSAAYFDGLALLAQMGSQYEQVAWLDVDHEKLLRLEVPEPRPQIKLIPRMMTRVVDLAAFEKLLPRSLKELKVYDPLGISAPREGDISVGEIVQLVTGVWRDVDERFPPELHGIAGDKPNLCLERF